MNWTKFFQGLAVAGISGAATSAAQAATTPGSTNKTLASSAAIGALVGVSMWLQQSPIKPKVKKPKPSDPPKDVN